MIAFTPNDVMLHNYIQNKLSENETEQVELWLADHPEVLSDLELDILFKHSRSEETFEEKSSKSFSFTNFFTSRKLIPIHVFAYVSMGYFIVNTVFDSSVSQQIASNFQIVSLSPMRGAGSGQFNPVARIKLRETKSDQLVLVIQLDFQEQETYSAEIINNNTDDVLVIIEDLRPIGVGDLNISIPTEVLYEGEFVLKVNKGENKIIELPFEIL